LLLSLVSQHECYQLKRASRALPYRGAITISAPAFCNFTGNTIGHALVMASASPVLKLPLTTNESSDASASRSFVAE
jgi:hypothetical protein